MATRSREQSCLATLFSSGTQTRQQFFFVDFSLCRGLILSEQFRASLVSTGLVGYQQRRCKQYQQGVPAALRLPDVPNTVRTVLPKAKVPVFSACSEFVTVRPVSSQYLPALGFEPAPWAGGFQVCSFRTVATMWMGHAQNRKRSTVVGACGFY